MEIQEVLLPFPIAELPTVSETRQGHWQQCWLLSLDFYIL